MFLVFFLCPFCLPESSWFFLILTGSRRLGIRVLDPQPESMKSQTQAVDAPKTSRWYQMTRKREEKYKFEWLNFWNLSMVFGGWLASQTKLLSIWIAKKPSTLKYSISRTCLSRRWLAFLKALDLFRCKLVANESSVPLRRGVRTLLCPMLFEGLAFFDCFRWQDWPAASDPPMMVLDSRLPRWYESGGRTGQSCHQTGWKMKKIRKILMISRINTAFCSRFLRNFRPTGFDGSMSSPSGRASKNLDVWRICQHLYSR